MKPLEMVLLVRRLLYVNDIFEIVSSHNHSIGLRLLWIVLWVKGIYRKIHGRKRCLITSEAVIWSYVIVPIVKKTVSY